MPWLRASDPSRDLLDAPRDAVAVQRAHRVQRLEHHQVERAVRNFERRRVHALPQQIKRLVLWQTGSVLLYENRPA